MPLSAIQKTIGGLVATGLAFALVVGTDAFLAYRLNDIKYWTLHTHRVIGELKDAQLALREVETADRGFAISGNRAFLKHYDHDRLAVMSHLAKVESMIQDNAPQRCLVREARLAAKEKLVFVKSIVDNPDHQAALAAIDGGHGQILMESFRKIVAQMTSNEDVLLGQRTQDLTNIQNVSWSLTGGLAVFTFFLLIWIYRVSQQAISEEQGIVASLKSEIEERKKIEKDLVNMTQKLVSSNTDLQQFAYVASHDLQEPLRAVAGFLTLIVSKNKGKLDSETEGWINHAVEGAQRMRALINDLLTYARVESQGKALEIIDCNLALQQAMQDLSVMISESNAVLTADQLPNVMGDKGQLAQLFQNLIGNSIKYRGVDAPNIALRVVESNDQWTFSVEDNGIGFEEEQAKRIFVIFQRLHGREEYQGTGIGLALCKKIVERHGGQIWGQSQFGKGSTFFSRFQFYQGAKALVSTPLNQPRKKQALKILLIEDSASDALLLSAKLQQVTEFAFDMEHVTSLASAMHRAESDSLDAIILDLSLPDSVGLAGYQKLRTKVSKTIPIIIVTGSNDRELVSEALIEGADNYLVKDTLDGNRVAVAILAAIKKRNGSLDSGKHGLIEG